MFYPDHDNASLAFTIPYTQLSMSSRRVLSSLQRETEAAQRIEQGVVWRWRGSRLEGAIAAARGTPILKLTSGTSALEHAGVGGTSPKAMLGDSGCGVGMYLARNPPQEGRLITHSAPGLLFGSRNT